MFLKDVRIMDLSACLPVRYTQTGNAQAGMFGTTVKKNLPACRDERGAGREVLGYGK